MMSGPHAHGDIRSTVSYLGWSRVRKVEIGSISFAGVSGFQESRFTEVRQHTGPGHVSHVCDLKTYVGACEAIQVACAMRPSRLPVMDAKIAVPDFVKSQPIPLPSIPKQIRRIVPALLALLLITFTFSGHFGAIGSAVLHRKATTFPRKIWQLWKFDTLNFEERDLNTARSWTKQNPSYRYEVLTDQNDLAWVEKTFGPEGFNRVDIVWIYRELTAKIIKADLLRYLIMYVEGGVYTDIDVEALRSIDHFIPERYNEHDIEMVLGVEIDQPDFIDHPVLGSKCQSFCQWTFMCKPHLPVMLTLVENIIIWLKGVAVEQNVPLGEIHLDFDQVISGTGPSAFTRAVLGQMSKNEGREVKWDEFHDLNESKLVGGVLVLTVEAFAAGQGHSDSGNHDTKHAIVKHHYHASKWPDKHPRFKHPMFGEVEECNWKPDCVKKWDEDTAEFAKLSPEEQARQVAVFEAKKAQEALDKEALEALEAMPPPL